MTLEKLAKQIFDECEKDGEPITMEEALEMAQMEIGAKDVSHDARAAAPTKEKKAKVVQVSQEKQMLFSEILSNLEDVFRENVQILTQNKLISVKIGEKTFKVDIIEQRKPKK